MPDPRHALGERAEEVVAAWLSARGWMILARRWRCPQGELDLVARDPDGTLVAIEVKLRRTARAGGPSESIDRHRLQRLRSALGRFAAESRAPVGEGMRVDLVGVRPTARDRWRLTHHRAIDAW
ncbi:MAG TPA: YraN family protein [Candidatus Limnocylindria bacterium]|nr:YraN family protein [Candidatus Limnocylindria bacterium]